jgi:gliding motility-associated-like protein
MKFFRPILPFIFLFGLLIGSLPELQGQVIYNMTTANVDDCKGTLLGSNMGTISGHYDHNENYTFTICVPGAQSITISFLAFCTEANYDFLRLFDGADTLSPQLGPSYSGNAIPPTISTTGPCLTLNFISDANVTCTGWIANWTTQVDEPDLPNMDMTGVMPTCSTTNFVVTFDRPIPCDSVFAGAFSIGGALANNVTSATPINCTNDSTTSASLNFSPGLNESGYYVINYSSFWRDQCDSIWTLMTSDTVAVNDCPLEVDLSANPDTICSGDCTNLFADASGGDFLTYSFAWANGLPNSAGPHQVCPTTTTTYRVTVTDRAGSAPATDSITIVVLPQPNMPAPIQVCETEPSFLLPAASPAGGYWDGPGITNPTTGRFDPGDAGGGFHVVQYYGPNGCPGDLNINVTPIDAGPPVAACPGSPPFILQNASPPGGTWGGMHVSTFGTFTPPPSQGTFRLGYTANGCTDSVTAYVDTITLTPIDTVCESLDRFNFTFWPPGGTWQGNGIVNAATGRFDASQAGLGSHNLTYRIFGCAKSFDIYVKEIDVGNPLVACPSQMPFSLPPASPAGGIWSGPGIQDPMLGIYNPSHNGNNRNDTLTYSVDGCEARLLVRVRQTVIRQDSLEFCLNDPPLDLDNANTGRNPWNGNWSGAGVTDPNYPGTFDPGVAGWGVHRLLYVANTCSATMSMIVHPPALAADTSVCEGSAPFNLRNNSPGGVYAGTGITDTLAGTFNAVLAGVGVHRIYYLPPTGCLDSMDITVFRPPTPQITNLGVTYCYRDTLITLIANPGGGTFSGSGVSGNTFNPALAGPGQHFIDYTIGSGACERSTVAVTTVGDPMSVQASFPADSICPGEFVTLSAAAQGGATGNFTYSWSPGGLEGPNQPVSPATTTTYTVTVTDGCTEPVTDQVIVYVSPAFSLEFSGSGPVCYGDSGYIAALVTGPSEYEIFWNTSPPFYGDTLFSGTAFNLEVTVTDLNSGCQRSGLTEIPSYPFVRAKFSANPNGDCVRLSDPTFDFIDLSTGGTRGVWDFGDGTFREYAEGDQVSHTYAAIGTYLVRLFLENEGSCADTFELEVCVVPEKSSFYVPNAFSPNGDQRNDLFLVKGVGIQTFSMRIFNRWGKLVYESTDPNEGWDGRYLGQDVPEGVYVYMIRGSILANNPQNNYAPVVLDEEGTLTLIR